MELENGIGDDFLKVPDNPFKFYDELSDVCQSNADYYKESDSQNGQKFLGNFIGLIDQIRIIKPLVQQIQEFAPLYDFDESHPGNGYRSFIYVVDCCVTHCLKLCRHVMANRNSLIFRKKFYLREVESCTHLMASLSICLQHLATLHSWSENGNLFPSEHHTPEELFDRTATINQYCFYGRCLGFQFSESVQPVLKLLAICMASFSETYYSNSGPIAKATNSMWTSGKYFLDPEARARRIVNISQSADISFCKAFWFLAESEIMNTLPSIVGTSIKINKVISIPTEPIRLPTHSHTSPDEEEFVDIPIPNSHLGVGSVSVRLLSSSRRRGMLGERESTTAPPSRGIIIHCHGGGFIAQSSKSHELYLREWTTALDVPILSIDYSLAPEAPYPRALEEVFYAYCWALNNCTLLGTTGEVVILAGDSAGANLNMGCAMRTIEMNVRPPDGIFLAYCPVLVSFVPSPSRLLCLMDPMLPFGFMMRCLKAYASPSADVLDNSRRRIDDQNAIKYAGTPECGPPTLSLDLDNSQLEHVNASEITIKSPMSDASSDTMASATLGNTEVPSPDGSAISFEEDSQPITLHPSSSRPVDSPMPEDTGDCESRQYGGSLAPSTSSAGGGQISHRSHSDENIVFDVGREAISIRSVQERIQRVAGNLAQAVSSTLTDISKPKRIQCGQSTASAPNAPVSNFDSLISRSPSDEFIFNVPKDPYMSPYWAPDSIVARMPPIKIVTTNLDPCLDDCISYAKKLKRLDRSVSLDIIPGLPHGFLNFAMLSRDAHEGSKLCITRISELLNDNNC